jgi:O-antigen/teichoic acid export membrane protein
VTADPRQSRGFGLDLGPLRRLSRLIDAEVAFGLSSKIANAVFGLGSVVLVGHFLSPSDQGFFFTFLSLAGLWMVVDLGLNTALIQFTSHECAAIGSAANDDERDRARSRLVSIGRFGLCWFLVGALAFLILGGIGGEVFFHHVPGGGETARGPWLLLAVAVACDIVFLPAWSTLEGAGYVQSVYRYRTYRMVCLAFGTWTVLALGGGLWSLPCGYLAMLPLSIFTAFHRHRSFFAQFLAPTPHAGVNWLRELMPLQWRLAVTWLAGYMVFWATTPICMKILGPVAAGRIGMALSLAIGIGSIGSGVVMVKFRQFGTLVALRRWKELDRLVLRQGAASVALILMGSAAVFAVAADLNAFDRPFANRLPTLLVLGGILLANLLLQATLPMAAYLRAHKREPFVWLTVGQSALTMLGVAILGARFGEIGVALAYLMSVVFFVCPVATAIFVHCRKEWHAAKKIEPAVGALVDQADIQG